MEDKKNGSGDVIGVISEHHEEKEIRQEKTEVEQAQEIVRNIVKEVETTRILAIKNWKKSVLEQMSKMSTLGYERCSPVIEWNGRIKGRPDRAGQDVEGFFGSTEYPHIIPKHILNRKKPSRLTGLNSFNTSGEGGIRTRDRFDPIHA